MMRIDLVGTLRRIAQATGHRLVITFTRMD
jgi:hypothetical protein